MSNRPQDDPHGSGKPAHSQAGVRRSWWPGWIWAIPIAVLLLVGWLGLRALVSGGKDITISFVDAHDLKKNNANVTYRGTPVGRVTGLKLNEQGDAVTVTVSIDARATQFLRSGTRFWLRGANPDLSNLSSIGAILSGPTIVMVPGPGKKTTHFTGLARKPISPAANARPVLYEVSFGGDAGSLKSGDPVTLHGFTVGEVQEVGFSYDAKTGDLSMPGTLALYPSLFHIRDTADPSSPAALRAVIGALIRKGLRARLDRDPPLVGSYRVTLDMMPSASAPAPVSVNGMPQIPLAAGGGLSSIVARINKLPLDQIAQNVLDITHHVDTLVSSPKLKDAIVQLDAALKQIHEVTAKAGPQITTLATTLRKTADDLDATARSTRKLMSGSATQNGLNTAVQELTEAARAVRSLANYLDRHPEALIRGR